MKKILTILLFIICSLIFVENVSALTFDLIAPEGPFQRNQNIQFTINIDTEEESYASTQVGMTYETQYLEYVSVLPGNTFTTVSADQQGEGRLIISGSSEDGFTGSGAYAYVTFKLIATAPGSTQLCALYNPEITPTPGPTSTPGGPSPTPGPTAPPGSTPTPGPTALPTSGDVLGVSRGLTFGLLFLILAGAGFFVFKKL